MNKPFNSSTEEEKKEALESLQNEVNSFRNELKTYRPKDPNLWGDNAAYRNEKIEWDQF